VGLFRVSGVFPTISKDGSKLAFVDNSFKAVWLADGQNLHKVYEVRNNNPNNEKFQNNKIKFLEIAISCLV
jgi:Tol biopolymer transport system component